MEENKETNKRLLFLILDEAINSLYENKQVNQLMESDENFSEIIEDYPLLRRPIVKDNQKVKEILQKYLPCLDENMDKIPEGLYLQLMNMNKEIYEAVK